jgi:DNA-binding CsgD family transcriptional regulator
VAALIATGLTNADIGRRLGVSVRTVDAHTEHLRNKLGVRTRAQIAVWSANSGAA